jgi:hypothetical protein
MKSSPDACSTVDTKMQIDGWYIDAAFALDCDSNRAYSGYRPKASGGCLDRYETRQIGTAKKGYPVWEKMTMFGPNGAESFSTTNEVVEFSQATLDPSLFDVPEGYRQVDDFASAFSAAYGTPESSSNTSTTPSSSVANTPTTQPNAPANQPGPKRAGVIRLGVAAVKTGNVTEGMNATELAAAVRNTLLENLKSGNVEVVLRGVHECIAQEGWRRFRKRAWQHRGENRRRYHIPHRHRRSCCGEHSYGSSKHQGQRRIDHGHQVGAARQHHARLCAAVQGQGEISR